VLLVDEAESHLHYDAQADLVRVFSRQQTVAKIIYTTHSAGCLPQDLGAGVRVVVPGEDGVSKLRNNFWTEGPGFSPLLTAMGASVLAFTPTRFAVVAEGASEVIMLPSLLREATGRGDLGFQVAPGLAELTPAAVPQLDLEAARVAYVVDDDKAGRAIRKKLGRGGVPDDLIVTLGGRSSGLVLEDMCKREAYGKAVNSEFARSHGEAIQMPETAVPAKGRPAALEAWCSQEGIEPPSKTAIAYRVLDICAEGEGIVARNRRAALVSTYRELARALRLDTRT
jgi:predicted ATP-dependent endonuclease of OLD family